MVLAGIAMGAVFGACASLEKFPGDLSTGTAGTAGGGTTTGMGATGGTGGTGGTAGIPECTSDNDAQCQAKPAPPCSKPVCSKEMCATTPDNSLAPTDDGNPCTDDSCVDGVETYTNNTISCGSNAQCEGGECIGCMEDADCPVKTACQTWSCEVHLCVPVNKKTDLFMDPLGDCTIRSCSNMGVLVVAEDLGDIPNPDNKECTKEECLGLGQPASTPQEGQACGAGPTCTNGAAKAQDTCDASGDCVTGGSVDCAPFACDVTSCKPICTGPADCIPAAYCDSSQSKCFDKKVNGTDCATGNECTSTFCAADDLVCCASACTAACKSCNAGGAAGSCGNLAKGVKDKCPDEQVCNGTGSCVTTNGKSVVGAVCMSSDDCCNHMPGNPSECVNGLCRLHVGEVCETSKPHECETNLCDALTHTCQECTTNADCPDMACDIPNKRCYLAAGHTCGTASDCSPGHSCTGNICI